MPEIDLLSLGKVGDYLQIKIDLRESKGVWHVNGGSFQVGQSVYLKAPHGAHQRVLGAGTCGLGWGGPDTCGLGGGGPVGRSSGWTGAGEGCLGAGQALAG